MPVMDKKAARKFIARRHPEWRENNSRWRWLADSLEGGNRYRFADYTVDPTALKLDTTPAIAFGIDPTTSMPTQVSYNRPSDRNLTPHVTETSQDGLRIYAMRLARTPVPNTVSRAIRRHLSRIFAHEVERDGPEALVGWWADVDGGATPIDKWMRKTVAPLLLVTGQLDLQFCHPPAESGEAEVRTRRDEKDLGLDRCVASYILPENMVWWELHGLTRRYVQCLVFERLDDGSVCYRHWTEAECVAYDHFGKVLPKLSFSHPYGVVPIVRVFDEKKTRSGNTGQSRYETIAELMKAKYNGRSELILGDVAASHATLMAPEDLIQNDGKIQVGPSGVLVMKKKPDGSYQEWKYLDPPKGAQEAVRQHIQDYDDEALADAAMLKPAGMTAGSTVAQSGVSKQADLQEGNDYLSEVAETLADAERLAAELALVVLSNGRPSDADLAAIEVRYPREFALYSTAELASFIYAIQQSASGSGQLPEVEKELFTRLVSVALPGLSDERQQELKDEIHSTVDAKAAAIRAPKQGSDPESSGGDQGLAGDRRGPDVAGDDSARNNAAPGLSPA